MAEHQETTTVDVEQIMREIREQAELGDYDPAPSFEEVRAPSVAPAVDPTLPIRIIETDDGRLQQFASEASFVAKHHYVPYYREVGTGLKSLVKRIIRKAGKPIIFPMSEEQNDLNYHLAESTNIAHAIADYHQVQLNRIQDALNGLHNRIGELEALNARLAEQEAHVAQQEARIFQLERSLDDLVQSISRTIQQSQSVSKSTAAVSTSSAPVENSTTTSAYEESEGKLYERVNEAESFDYFAFENAFRGTQNDIMDRQRVYVPYFKDKSGKVFDLGCGRGEFLRLLKDEGIDAFGADMFPEYEVTGKLYDIDIRIGDGIAMLEQMEEKLGGIFCAQVIEHIGFENIQKLCKLAYDKLEEGAYLVLETPNPMCVSMFTNAFYIDPTHEKPVHPMLMEYLLKMIGFKEVQLLLPEHGLEQLPEIKSDAIENLDEINQAINRVSGFLFGSQDYGIVAKR